LALNACLGVLMFSMMLPSKLIKITTSNTTRIKLPIKKITGFFGCDSSVAIRYL
jgi:hypothetical protein